MSCTATRPARMGNNQERQRRQGGGPSPGRLEPQFVHTVYARNGHLYQKRISMSRQFVGVALRIPFLSRFARSSSFLM